MTSNKFSIPESSSAQVKMGVALLAAWTGGVLWIVNSVASVKASASAELGEVKTEIVAVSKATDANRTRIESMNSLLTLTLEAMGKDVDQKQQFTKLQLDQIFRALSALEARVLDLERQQRNMRLEKQE